MLSRRDLIFSGALASRVRPASMLKAQSNPQSPCSDDGPALREIRDALRDLRRTTVSSDLTDIRERQRTHFKINQKLPDCIDVGIRVWERIYDWHLENTLPLKISRAVDGRMEMEVMLTALVLRADIADAQIGVPYDR
jgi:hypothetical protein